MDLSVYTPVSSAIGVIVAVIASVIFRERLGIFSYLAAAVACVAVII
jgi:drug/metabolite transporter (DMT)-like permease